MNNEKRKTDWQIESTNTYLRIYNFLMKKFGLRPNPDANFLIYHYKSDCYEDIRYVVAALCTSTARIECLRQQQNKKDIIEYLPVHVQKFIEQFVLIHEYLVEDLDQLQKERAKDVNKHILFKPSGSEGSTRRTGQVGATDDRTD